MIDTENKQEKGNQSNTPPLSMRLSLNNVKNSRASMARIMRLYVAGQIDDTTFRNLIYAFSSFIKFLTEEKKEEMEVRLDTLEKTVREAQFSIIGVDVNRDAEGQPCDN